jgi:hypothetical protein
VAEGVVDISHEGLRILLREKGVTFRRLKTWKASKVPQYAAKKVRIGQLYVIADREATPGDGDPEVIFCVDEFGPLNLQPRPGRQWAARPRGCQWAALPFPTCKAGSSMEHTSKRDLRKPRRSLLLLGAMAGPGSYPAAAGPKSSLAG